VKKTNKQVILKKLWLLKQFKLKFHHQNTPTPKKNTSTILCLTKKTNSVNCLKKTLAANTVKPKIPIKNANFNPKHVQKPMYNKNNTTLHHLEKNYGQLGYLLI